jgi:hypothetical protein
MATLVEARLAPVTARDGADTRNKDNSGKAAAGTGEVTLLGGGDQTRVGQTAAITYLLPPGADVANTAMNAYWTNYLRTADAYVQGDPLEFFKFTSFKHQQGFNEADIKRECYKLGGGEEMLTIYRQFYNAYVTEYLAEPTPLRLKHALEFLADYNKELAEQNNAAKLIQQAYKSFKAPKHRISETGTFIAEDDRQEDEFVEDHPKCSCGCGEVSMFEDGGMCADCYWTEDSRIKTARRRAFRQNAIPSGDITVGLVLVPQPEVDIDALIQRAICPKQIPNWDAFWAKHYVAGLKISVPKVKKPCKCGAESTRRVNGKQMCEPCADFAENVGECCDCGVVAPRLQHKKMCQDCWEDYLEWVDQVDQQYNLVD